MRTGEFDIAHADGKILLNEIKLDTGILPKGHKLNREDLLYLKMSGIKKLSLGIVGISDMTADSALSNIAPKICGKNIVFTTPIENTCKIVAEKDGVMICQNNRINKFNRMSSKITLNVITPYQAVKKGDVVGVLSVFPPVIEDDLIEEIGLKLSGNESLLNIEEPINEEAAIIYTRFYDDEKETNHVASVVRKIIRNYASIGLNFNAEYACSHNVDDLAETIAKVSAKHHFVMIISALPTCHPKDTVPSAMKSIVDTVVCEQIPQIDAPDLLIATKRRSKIINIPYNYDKADTSVIDELIKIAVKKEKINQTDFISGQNILLPMQSLTEEEKNNLIAPNPDKKGSKEASIAAVILAAGTATRARRNKLMVKVDGKPLFMKAVEAALKSKASPIFVVTGYEAESLEDQLEEIDINILRNHDYNSGVKTSIRLGLRSIPSFCDGALIIPADMPNITTEYLNKMIDSFDKKQENQLLVATYKGCKYNPVLWSKSLYEVADLVPESSHLRQVFLEHSDYIELIETTENCCLDVNYPNDLEVLIKDIDEDTKKVG